MARARRCRGGAGVGGAAGAGSGAKLRPRGGAAVPDHAGAARGCRRVAGDQQPSCAAGWLVDAGAGGGMAAAGPRRGAAAHPAVAARAAVAGRSGPGGGGGFLGPGLSRARRPSGGAGANGARWCRAWHGDAGGRAGAGNGDRVAGICPAVWADHGDIGAWRLGAGAAGFGRGAGRPGDRCDQWWPARGAAGQRAGRGAVHSDPAAARRRRAAGSAGCLAAWPAGRGERAGGAWLDRAAGGVPGGRDGGRAAGFRGTVRVRELSG